MSRQWSGGGRWGNTGRWGSNGRGNERQSLNQNQRQDGMNSNQRQENQRPAGTLNTLLGGKIPKKSNSNYGNSNPSNENTNSYYGRYSSDNYGNSNSNFGNSSFGRNRNTNYPEQTNQRQGPPTANAWKPAPNQGSGSGFYPSSSAWQAQAPAQSWKAIDRNRTEDMNIDPKPEYTTKGPRPVDNPPAKQMSGSHRVEEMEVEPQYRRTGARAVDNTPAWVREENRLEEMKVEPKSMNTAKEKSFKDTVKSQLSHVEFNFFDVDLNAIGETVTADDWVKKKKLAANHAIVKTQKFMREYEKDTADSDSESNVSDSSGEEILNKRSRSSLFYFSEDDVKAFFNGLVECVAFDLGFHINGYDPKDEWNCWCPCSKKLQPWREKFKVDFVKDCDYQKGAPDGLMGHLRSKGYPHDSTFPCPIHRGVVDFLTCLYMNINDGKGHPGLFMKGDVHYNQAIAEQNKQKRKAFKFLQDENARYAKELAASKLQEDKMKKLEKLNKDLATKVKQLEEFKKKLGAERKEEVKISEEEMERFANCIYKYFENFQTMTADKLILSSQDGKDSKTKEKSNQITIKVKPPKGVTHAKVDVQDLFEKYYEKGEKDTSYLFRELKNSAWKCLHSWNIEFVTGVKVEAEKKKKKEKTRYEKGEQAKDEGGPTREFLSQVWKQMGDLKVKFTNKDGKEEEIQLFEFEQGGYIPVSDDKFNAKLNSLDDGSGNIEIEEEKKQILMQIKKYYRALGRIMVHSMACREHIPQKVMPAYYLNVIFRGLQPTDNEYDKNDLIDHLFSGSESASTKKFLKENLDNVAEDVIANLQKTYFDGKKIAIESFKEGLTLDGEIFVIDFLRIIPLKAIQNSCFAPTDITAEQVIEILKPDYTYTESFSDAHYKNRAENFFENILKELIREREDMDAYGQEWLQKFVAFCSGSYFVPFHKTWFITVEFNFEEMKPNSLPVSHSCDRQLKLPGEAYENKEIFAKKLDESIFSTVGTFFMT